MIKIKKIIFSNVAFSFLIIALGLIGSILISRTLGPAQRGEIAAIILWPVLLLHLGSFGTYRAVIYHFSKKNRNVENFLGNCLVITFLNSIVSIFIGSILIFFSLQLLSLDFKWYSFYLLLFLPLNIINQFISSILQALTLFKEYDFVRLFFPVFYLIGILCLFSLNNLTVFNIIILQMFIMIFQLLAFLYLYNSRVSSIFNIKYNKRTVKIIYSYGSKVWLGELSQGLNVKMDQIFISGMLSPRDLGIYVVASSVANFSSIVPNAFKTVYMPLISSTKKISEKFKMTRKILLNFLLINIGLTILYLIVLPILIPILYGNEFRDSIFISFILLIGFLFFNFKIVLSSIIQGFGKPIIVSYSEIIGFIVLIIIVYPCTNLYGIMGASSAISFSYLVQCFTLYILFNRFKNKNNE